VILGENGQKVFFWAFPAENSENSPPYISFKVNRLINKRISKIAMEVNRLIMEVKGCFMEVNGVEMEVNSPLPHGGMEVMEVTVLGCGSPEKKYV
jgi:hypothetical protein